VKHLAHPDGTPATKESVVELLKEHKITCNHVKDAGGRRGQSAHDALEAWAEHGRLPNPEVYDEEERGYVVGLRKFLETVEAGAENGGLTDVETEVMVGSLEHGYAGRYDLRWNWSGGTVVTGIYPKRKDKVEDVPAGRYLLDLKTSKYVYSSHFLQLEAYEGASVECGYWPTEHRAVVRVSADGRYEFVRNPGWTLDDFLAVKGAYLVTARKGWR
jgi:hypothetical protein